MRATGDTDLLFIDRTHALTCPGCGQTGVLPAAEDDPREQRLRIVGFYRHGSGAGEVVACCRCQQTVPAFAISAAGGRVTTITL